MSSTIAPLLFVSHGAPTFAMEPGILGPKLQEIGQNLEGVKAILIISPHWQTEELEVTSGGSLETIHDFYGFPKALYDIEYPVQGSPELAKDVLQLLHQAGFAASEDTQRGLDHGAWVPLLYLLPKGNIPVCQLSLPFNYDPLAAYRLGQVIAELRQQGIFILCSGGVTHNLQDFRMGLGGDLPYVKEFSNWVKNTILENRLDELLYYRQSNPNALRAHPTEEHFLPLFTALGARLKNSEMQTIDGGITYGILAMDAYYWTE